jgi:hypothetical protein
MMARARLVKAGVTLRDQVNNKWKSRDKRSDGWIGNADHQARPSDHNPDKDGWVHAIDIDEDFLGKEHGEKIAKEFADQLIKYAREGKDNGRLKYVVYENKIASGTYPNQFWVWRNGSWGHTKHIHVSFTDKAEQDGSKFDLPIFRDENAHTPQKPQEKPNSGIPFPGGAFIDFGKRNDYVRQMQKQLIAKGYKIPSGATGRYLSETENAVKQFYRKEMRLTSNGKKMGPKAWNRLFGN